MSDGDGFVRRTVRDAYVLAAAEILFDSQLHKGGRRNNINRHALQYLLAMAEWQIFVGTDLSHRMELPVFLPERRGKNDHWHFS
jgi:hypothetical protein